MPPQRIIDSHVHIIPSSAANSTSHAWLHPSHPLARQWSVADYLATSSPSNPHHPPSRGSYDLRGFIYVETDRAVGPTHLRPSQRWQHPLSELRHLRSVVEGDAEESASLLGIVPWAPVDQGARALEEYLSLAEEVAGPRTWRRVKGFRYLVQGMKQRAEFEAVVLGDAFVEGLRLLGRRGYVFDVGVDQRQGGVWQLEIFLECVRRARRGVPNAQTATLVLSKPPPLFSLDGRSSGRARS